jgi:2-polyprenyl-3-methyl-5-hydroxy-6-metoxy-1,4-benzoquinol methylase
MTLESVSHCPACGQASRSVVYDNVPDFVFRATEERWSIAKCSGCETLYLPVRPSVGAIGRYYASYYTHDDDNDAKQISGIGVRSSFLKRLANSWRNHRYGTRRESLGLLGVAVMFLVWPLRRWIDAECRHLPASRDRPGQFRVLDIGFGDGRFLRFASEAGCTAVGFEMDQKAVDSAARSGMSVFQGDALAALRVFGKASFEYVTMSHVIEHVHSPREVLAAAADLLADDGLLWLETPNPSSIGHSTFRDRWRDLDPPRHLVIMQRDALIALAASCGLELDEEYRRPFVAFEVFPFSARSADPGSSRVGVLFRAGIAELIAALQVRRSEWLTLRFRRARSH